MKERNIILTKIFFLIQLIDFANSSTCTKKLPFLKNNECVSFCSSDELKSKNCSIEEDDLKNKYCI